MFALLCYRAVVLQGYVMCMYELQASKLSVSHLSVCLCDCLITDQAAIVVIYFVAVHKAAASSLLQR